MITSFYLVGALLALAGGALSFYFYGVYKGFLSGKQWWIPSVCQLDGQTCMFIMDTHFGKIAGIPNALSGTVFLLLYAAVLLGTDQNLVPVSVPLLMGMFTMFIGVYLVFGLVKLSARCVVCLTVHSLNLIIFILQLIYLL